MSAQPIAPAPSIPEPRYGRPCFICDRTGDCGHREPQIEAAIRAAAREFHDALRGVTE